MEYPKPDPIKLTEQQIEKLNQIDTQELAASNRKPDLIGMMTTELDRHQRTHHGAACSCGWVGNDLSKLDLGWNHHLARELFMMFFGGDPREDQRRYGHGISFDQNPMMMRTLIVVDDETRYRSTYVHAAVTMLRNMSHRHQF